MNSIGGGGLSGGAIAGIILGIIGLFVLAGGLLLYFRSRCGIANVSDSDRFFLIAKGEKSRPLGQMVTASPNLEKSKPVEKPNAQNDKGNVGGPIYWNKYI